MKPESDNEKKSISQNVPKGGGFRQGGKSGDRAARGIRSSRTTSVLGLVVLSAFVLIAAGCAPHYKATGYHTSYEELINPDDQSDLFIARASNIDLFPDCYAIYLAPPRAYGPVLADDDELREDLLELIPQRIYVQMRSYYAAESIQVSVEPPDVAELALDGKHVYELETAITEVRKGFGPARWLLGFYLGHTTIQIEGRLRTLPERTEVARYVVRVLHGGNGYFGLNPKSLKAQYCLRVSVDWAAMDLAALPELVFGRERLGRAAWERAHPLKPAPARVLPDEAAPAKAEAEAAKIEEAVAEDVAADKADLEKPEIEEVAPVPSSGREIR